MTQAMKTTAIVCSFDEALMEAPESAIIEYIKTRDIDVIKEYLQGKSPTTFYVRPIPGSIFNSYVMGASNDHEQLWRAFRAGVVRVENMVREDGSVSERVAFMDESKPSTMADESLCYEVPPAVAADIGRYVFDRSFLGRTSGVSYRVPLSSVHAYRMLQSSRHAEPSSTPATGQNTEPSSNATEVAPETHRAATG